METEKLEFNFHNIAGASITCDSVFANDFFQDEYRYHTTSDDISALPTVELSYYLNKKIPASFTHYRHKLLANLGFDCELSDTEVSLSIYGNRMAVPIAHHMLLHSGIRWLAANNSAILLHAGAVAKNNKSVIFSGMGGAGKTTTTSLILSANDGWQIHADDYIFLKDSQSKAYVTRSHLYRDLLSWVPEVGVRLTPWERIKLEFLGEIRKRTMEGIKWPVRLSANRLWPNTKIADTATPAAILLLERDQISKPELVEITNKELAVEELIEMNFYEARHFISLMKKSGKYSESWFKKWYSLEKDQLKQILSTIPVYKFVLPYYSDNAKQSKELLESINELVK